MKIALIISLFSISILAALTVSAKKVVTKTEVKTTTEAKYAPAGKTLSFKQADGKVRFLAVGKPAMIKIVGEGTGPHGDLTIADDKLQGTLTIDMKMLTTKIDLRDEHMKNKYLEVEKYPTSTITFKNYSLKLASLTPIAIEQPFTADLQLHGVTKPVVGTIKFSKEILTVTGVATFKIKVTDFMDTLPSYAGIKIADDIEVTVDLKTTTN
ncbi:MAG: YceI family protein [Bdellovibrionaceae bacterium]|nr:YceI family protein [Pseudobdellovibrionaceae bacterium]